MIKSFNFNLFDNSFGITMINPKGKSKVFNVKCKSKLIRASLTAVILVEASTKIKQYSRENCTFCFVF